MRRGGGKQDDEELRWPEVGRVLKDMRNFCRRTFEGSGNRRFGALNLCLGENWTSNAEGKRGYFKELTVNRNPLNQSNHIQM